MVNVWIVCTIERLRNLLGVIVEEETFLCHIADLCIMQQLLRYCHKPLKNYYVYEVLSRLTQGRGFCLTAYA